MRSEITIRPGDAVEASDGRLGTVEEVVVRPGSGEIAYLSVRQGWTDRLLHVDGGQVLPPDGDATDGTGAVRLRLTRAEAERLSATVATTGTGDVALGLQDGSRLRVPILEERLSAEARAVDMGELRIHKRVETTEGLATTDVTRDEVDVERVPVNRPLDAPVESRIEGDWIVVPVMEEVLVVSKQLMLKEEVRVRRRPVTAPQEVRETLRHERVEVEDATARARAVSDAQP